MCVTSKIFASACDTSSDHMSDFSAALRLEDYLILMVLLYLLRDLNGSSFRLLKKTLNNVSWLNVKRKFITSLRIIYRAR